MKDVFEWADVSLSAAFLTNVKIPENKTQEDVVTELASAAGVYAQWGLSDKPKLSGTWTDILKAHVIFTQYLSDPDRQGLDDNHSTRASSEAKEEPDVQKKHDTQNFKGSAVNERKGVSQEQYSERNEVYVNITVSSPSFADILSHKKSSSLNEAPQENHNLCPASEVQSSETEERLATSPTSGVEKGGTECNEKSNGEEFSPFVVHEECRTSTSAMKLNVQGIQSADGNTDGFCNQVAADTENLALRNSHKNECDTPDVIHSQSNADSSDTAKNIDKHNCIEAENLNPRSNAKASHSQKFRNISEKSPHSNDAVSIYSGSKRNTKLNVPLKPKHTPLNISQENTSKKEVSYDMNKKVRRKNYEELAPFKFFCSQCSFKSKRESHYQRHVQLHNQVSHIYECEKCSFKTIRLGNLRRHELSHSESELSCDLCTYRTLHHKLLIRHQRNKHINKLQNLEEKEVMTCSHCSYTTMSPYLLKRHSKVHSLDFSKNQLIYECSECSYKASRKEHLARHASNVHGCHRPFLCHHCGKAFKRQDALKQHSAVHLSHPPFRCPTCDKGCRSQAHLKQHLSVHSARRLFLCELCGASFKTRAVQRKHILTIHHHPKAYSCLHCSRRFNTKYALRRHMKQHFERKQKPTSLHLEMNGQTPPKYEETCPTVHLLPSETEKNTTDQALGTTAMPVNNHTTCSGQAEGEKMAVQIGNCAPESVQIIPTHTFIHQNNETATALLYLTGSYSSY